MPEGQGVGRAGETLIQSDNDEISISLGGFSLHTGANPTRFARLPLPKEGARETLLNPLNR